MNESKALFPPAPTTGSRVWSGRGFQNHGPSGKEKVNVASDQGGTIESTEEIAGQFLYAIRWDDGTTSKHYRQGVFCIGRFKTLKEFEGAIKVEGKVDLTAGPQGGFKSARLCLVYDGVRQDINTRDRRLWKEILEPLIPPSRIKETRTK